MKTPEAIAQECALEVAITCDKFSERDGCRIVDRLSPLIAAAIREATEQEFATINAERAESRDTLKEMIKAQDEVAKLRAALDEAEGALKRCREAVGPGTGAELAADKALARIVAAARSGKADTSDSPTDS